MSGKYWIIQGDVREVCEQLPDNYFDGVLTDPPYGYKFLGKTWDYQVPDHLTWLSVLKSCKPGAHLLSFGGSRTYHRVAVEIEDGGWELRDQLQWMYAKGFPKSLNVSKAIDKKLGVERPVIGEQKLTGNAAVSLKDKGGTYGVQVGTVPAKIVPITGPGSEEAHWWDGYGTALKPAFEPIALARKSLDGTVVDNALKWGTGALAIDACRVPRGEGSPGGWPNNLILDDGAAEVLDSIVGERPSGKVVKRNGGGGKIFKGLAGNEDGQGVEEDQGYMDGKTNPSRFFFSAKVSTKEREAGCESLPLRSAGDVTDREDGSDGLNSPRAGAGRGGGARNTHPTLKPIALCEYLAKMILPPPRVGGPPRRLLVPFSGAGSEMIGALRAGWDEVVGIELDADGEDFIQIACLRIAYWTSEVARKAA